MTRPAVLGGGGPTTQLRQWQTNSISTAAPAYLPHPKKQAKKLTPPEPPHRRLLVVVGLCHFPGHPQAIPRSDGWLSCLVGHRRPSLAALLPLSSRHMLTDIVVNPARSGTPLYRHSRRPATATTPSPLLLSFCCCFCRPPLRPLPGLLPAALALVVLSCCASMGTSKAAT